MSTVTTLDTMMLRRVVETLPRYQYGFANEIELHRGIEEVLTSYKIPFAREVVASPKDRFDFLVAGHIVIEAKTKGAMPEALRQCCRYAARDDVLAVVLVTTRFWGRCATEHTTTNNKTIRVVRLQGKSF